MKATSSKPLLIYGLWMVLLALIIGNLLLGPSSIAMNASQIWWDILFELRMPRTIVALLAGAMLAVNGLMLQNWLHNPLAAPYVLGIESLSTFGILLWTLTIAGVEFVSFPWLAQLSYAAAGFISSFLGMFLFLFLFRLWGRPSFILIVGLLMGGLVSGLTNMVASVVPIEKIKGLYFWGMGSFENIYGSDLIIFILILMTALLIIYAIRHRLATFALGEMYVRSLGINPSVYLNAMVILVSVSVGTICAYCGPIAFVSIITPFLARRLWRKGSFSTLIVPTAILGAMMALLAQLIIAVIPTGIPLNGALGLMGFPILIWMVWGSRKEILV